MIHSHNIRVSIPNERLLKAARLHNLLVFFIPFLGSLIALMLAYHSGVTLFDFEILLIMYVLTILGVEVGYHRYFTHKSFETKHSIKIVLGVLGSMAAQAPLIYWVSNHRLHHSHSDKSEDPHSPYFFKNKKLGPIQGLWHAHMGWTFNHDAPNTMYFAKDLLQDATTFKISQLYPLWVIVGILTPAIIGFIFYGYTGAISGFLWGGMVRIFVTNQVIFSINSICHYFGKRPFDNQDGSKNNIWLAIPSFGQSWHNNHHAFPNSAKTGFKWWQFDLGGWLIQFLKWTALAWDVKVPLESQIDKRLKPQLN